MKRSEMVDTIGDFLAMDGVVQKSCMWIDDMANEILEVIEKEGMLPPAWKIDNKVYWKDEAEHTWENENEM